MMVGMAQQPPASAEPPASSAGPPAGSTAVVEWGDTTSGPRRPLPRFLSGLGRDRRLVPLVAGLGAVALFASLVSEWQVTTVTSEFFGGPDLRGDQRVLTGIGDLGAWGAGYLIGIFLLACATALAMFGPAVVARAARVVALTSAGVLLTLLVAMAIELGERSVALGSIFYLNQEVGKSLEYGRGIPCAFVGVCAVALAAHLAGRLLPAAPGAAAGAADPEPGSDRDADLPGSWRRRPPAPGYTSAPPIDLTVEPATPFTPLPDGRDRPL